MMQASFLSRSIRASENTAANSFDGVLKAHGVTKLPSGQEFHKPYNWNIDYTPYRKNDLTVLSLDSLSFANTFQLSWRNVQTMVDSIAEQTINAIEANRPVVVDEFVALARNSLHKIIYTRQTRNYRQEITNQDISLGMFMKRNSFPAVIPDSLIKEKNLVVWDATTAKAQAIQGVDRYNYPLVNLSSDTGQWATATLLPTASGTSFVPARFAGVNSSGKAEYWLQQENGRKDMRIIVDHINYWQDYFTPSGRDTLYRIDSRPPEEIFRDGFGVHQLPLHTPYSLEDHLATSNRNYVSTTTDHKKALEFAKDNIKHIKDVPYYLYTITNTAGIDIAHSPSIKGLTIYGQDHIRNEREVAVPYTISPDHIERAAPVISEWSDILEMERTFEDQDNMVWNTESGSKL